MNRVRLVTFIIVSTFLHWGCSTTFQSTWTAPDATPLKFAGQLVVAMVVVPDEGVRRSAEDKLVSELDARGVTGIASYRIIPDAERSDRDKVKARLQQANAAGIVVMQVTRTSQQVSSVGPYYTPAYYGYYGGWDGWGWDMPAYSGGYLQIDTLVYVETLVYSLRQNKLVWAGQSETINPTRVDKLVHDVAKAAARELKKAGLITRT
jgi:hypothetical protein